MLKFQTQLLLLSLPPGHRVPTKVNAINDLTSIIIPHFTKFPLLTQKYSDFALWSLVVEMVSFKEHLTEAGFAKVLPIYAYINRGVSAKAAERWYF